MSRMRLETISAAPAGRIGTREGVAGGQVEIDVTPVMNLFMILIPFLVSMVFFSHLAFQSFELPANETGKPEQAAGDLSWTVALTADGVVLTRGDIVVGRSARTGAGYDFAAMAGLLADARGSYPDVERVVVAVDDGVVAADLVRALDCAREAGFAQIGVAAGTGPDGATATDVASRRGGRS